MAQTSDTAETAKEPAIIEPEPLAQPVSVETTIEAVVKDEPPSSISTEEHDKKDDGDQGPIEPPKPEPEPGQQTAVVDETPRDPIPSAAAQEQDDEGAISTKKKGKKKKAKKAASLETPEHGLEQHTTEEPPAEPLDIEEGDDISPAPLSGDTTQETPDEGQAIIREPAEAQVPVAGVENSPGPDSETHRAIVEECATTPSDEPANASEASPSLTNQLPEHSTVPELASVEDAEVSSISKKDKTKKKKGKKSTASAEFEAPQSTEAAEPSIAADTGSANAPSTPTPDPSTEQVDDTARSILESTPSVPEPETKPESPQQPIDTSETTPETTASAETEGGGQDDPAPSSKKSKKKKKRGKATSEGTTPAPSRPASPILGGEPIVSADKPSEDAPRPGSPSEVAPEAVLEHPIERPGDPDQSSREPVTETTIAEDSGVAGAILAREQQDPSGGLSTTPAEDTTETKFSIDTPGYASQEPPETTLNEQPSLDPTPQDVQETGVSPELSKAEVDTPDLNEQETLSEERASTKSKKKKKGKKGKKGTSEPTTPAISRPESPVTQEISTPPEEITEQPSTTDEPVAIPSEATAADKPESEPIAQDVEADSAIPAEAITGNAKSSIEDVIEPGLSTEFVPTETEIKTLEPGAAKEHEGEARDDVSPTEKAQPLSPVTEEAPPDAGADNTDGWGLALKKLRAKKDKGNTDFASTGAGLGLFQPASPARDDNPQSFRTSDQGETGDRTDDFPTESGSRADASETRELPAAADDGGAGGAERQDATQGESPTIPEPVPSANEETSAHLHDAAGPESVSTPAEVGPREGTGSEPGVSGEDSTVLEPANTKTKGRKGKKKGQLIHAAPGASIHPYPGTDEDIHFPEARVEPDTSVSVKPEPEPAAQAEERHEPGAEITLEPSAKQEPGAQSDVQPKIEPGIRSWASPEVESGIQRDIRPEGETETQPDIEPKTQSAAKDTVEEPRATLTPQPEAEPTVEPEDKNTDPAAEPSTPREPPEPETKPDIGHEAHVPTQDVADDGFNVSKKKSKKGKKKGKSASATPVASRPLSPANEDKPTSLSEHDEVSTRDTPAAKTGAEFTREEPVVVEEAPEDWATTSKKKKKGKKGKVREEPSQAPIAAASRSTSPVVDEPGQDSEATPTETPSHQAQNLEPSATVPIDDEPASPSTSRQAELIDEPLNDQDQIWPAEGDAESAILPSVEKEGDDEGMLTKEDKKRAQLPSDTATPTASRANSPTREIKPPLPAPTESHLGIDDEWAMPRAPLPAATESQIGGDEWALPSKKKSRKKSKKAKAEHDTPEQSLDLAKQHLLLQEQQPGSTTEPPSSMAEPRTLDTAAPTESSRELTQETHLTPAQETSHIIHDAPPAEMERPEKKLKTEDVDGLMASEPTVGVEEQQLLTQDKGKDVDMTLTRDVDNTLLETETSKDEIEVSTGAAADKLGGETLKLRKKGKKKAVNKGKEREDVADDPMLWESANRKTLTDEAKVVGEEGLWGIGDGQKKTDKGEPGAVAPTKGDEEGRVEVASDKHVEAAGGERRLEDVTVSTVLGGDTDVGKASREELVAEAAPGERKRAIEETQFDMPMEISEVHDKSTPVASERALLMADTTKDPHSMQGTRGIPKLERTWEESDESPVLGREEVPERHLIAEEAKPVLPVTPTRDTFDDSPYPSLRRSISRNLEPVPEEETETFSSPTRKKERHSRKLAPEVSDANRDSGFATDSSRHSQRSQWQQEGPHRDSGVHLRDWAESPRQVSPEPSTSRAMDPFKTPETSERRLKRSPRSIKDLGEHEHPTSRTPMFPEPSPQAPTPEPQKPLHKYKTPDPARSRYQDLGTANLTPKGQSAPGLAQAAPLPRTRTDSPGPSAGAGGGQRSVSDNTSRPRHTPSPDVAPRRVASNTSLTRHRTPDPKLRPDTPGSIRSLHSATPPLRRASRRISGDLRSISLSQRGQAEAPSGANSSDEQRSAQNSTPVANEGRVRSKDMTDVYVSRLGFFSSVPSAPAISADLLQDGFGEGRIGSPRSPTRPHSMRRRQSMQVIELEAQVNELIVQNQLLQQERQHYGDQSHAKKSQSLLADRDAEIDVLKRSIEQLNREVSRLVEVNEGLNAANAQLSNEQNTRYRDLELLHAEASRELETTRSTQGTYDQRLQEKDAEIADLRDQLDTARAKIQEMQDKILETSRPADADFLDLRDVDYFDRRCQQLCQHVQQWVLRFSKFSDMRSCRLTSEINDEKIIDRLDNTILDGSDVDKYLRDRVRRRDVFMSMTMNMIWEFVFTRYLFGMDREQRQKLKSLEKHLTEVGPAHAVRQWRAVTLTLLSRRPSFKRQRELDSEAVVQAVLDTLSLILPPPTHLEDQIQSTLRRVMNEAVDLAVMMRTQRAEYMMLPPLEPKYDADGELAETVTFNASLMKERSGDRSVQDEELQAQAATVRIVLFPLVVRKGDETGVGDDEVVVCPAQVLVARSSRRRSTRGATPSDLGGAPVGGSAQDPSEYGTELSRLP